jgi:uncharacterized protein with gpF-like domain
MGRFRRAFSRVEHSVIYRAHYAIEAAKRLTVSLRSGKTIQEARAKEAPYFARHREAVRQRDAARRMVEAAQDKYGPVLGWRHGNPKEPRPTHLAADGKNFRADTVPTSTGALPGVLPNCTCTVTAPFENAELLR